MLTRVKKSSPEQFKKILDNIVKSHVDNVLYTNFLTREMLTIEQLEKAEIETREALLEAWGING